MAKQNESLNKILIQTDGLYFIYVPAVGIALESVPAGIMLCYLVHWEGKGWRKDGWIYKTIEEMLSDTGLTRNQQDTAIKVLRKHNFVEVARKGFHGKRNYRVNMDIVEANLMSLWKNSKHYSAPAKSNTISDKEVSRKAAFKFAINQQAYTEETGIETPRINTSLPVRLVQQRRTQPDAPFDVDAIYETLGISKPVIDIDPDGGIDEIPEV